jgi:hypothetical protein
MLYPLSYEGGMVYLKCQECPMISRIACTGAPTRPAAARV